MKNNNMIEEIDYLKIGSGSKGNAILVQTKLLLDCGVSYVKLARYLRYIKVIFVSHQHQDHLLPTTIKKISYNYPNIKFVTSSKEVVIKLKNLGVDKKNIFYLTPKKWYSLGIMKVKTEPLEHDAENYGLKWEYESKKGFYATDTSSLDNIRAENYDLYLIEANYSEELLKKHIEECEDENQLYYLSRVKYTHLSQEQANSFLIENMGDNSKYEYIHQSSYNFEEE